MRLQNYPTDQSNYFQFRKACDVIREVDGVASNICRTYTPDENGQIRDKFYSTGVGYSIYELTKKGSYTVQLEPGSQQARSMDYHYTQLERDVTHTNLRIQPREDGSKFYSRRVFHDGGGQITSHSEHVTVHSDGKYDYDLIHDKSVDAENWMRRNPSVRTLTHMGVGAALGSGLGYLAGGGWGATVGGLVASAIGGQVARDKNEASPYSNHSNLEYKVWRRVDQLQTGVNIAAALTGIGTALYWARPLLGA